MQRIDGVNGPHIYFTGANIHIVSGSTTTADSVTGLGNLIIGYDEVPNAVRGGLLSPGDRGGSHNLIIGRGNRFTTLAFGGLVAGEANVISNGAASVSGGNFNSASGVYASVSGGIQNTASGRLASVSGGSNNTASGLETVVIGGVNVIANNAHSIAPGGILLGFP